MHNRPPSAPRIAAMSFRHSAIRNPQSALAPGVIFLFLAALLAPPLPAQDDPFAAGVRTTPWLSSTDEQKLFKLPEGFEINLVAAEPDIQKPLNMAFDERGRIWLTCSVEYPYAAPADRPGRDKIMVLEDTDGDGRYEKVQTFADGLNIPMGIYPWKGGCIAFSIPNIWHFEDTDGDGVCDQRTVLYGPFDTSRDTHGMVSSMRRGWDGWVYACHGFNNDSRVKGTDGHEVHMQSGNVFRFQLDGSRIEHFTHGQVNPFGMCFDGLFNIFTADCHSKPIYQLLRGGHYPSFGKPHDGLGFVPPMMDHLHGSTAICGLVCYSGENFPEEYRGNFFSGNVMTSRINRNKPEYHGSTIKAIEQPDFLSTTDPWFRPVDLQIGPDGALYIADFYNRIIGHYEVPLPHPGRDRTSGRIWRVVYKGDDPKTKPAKMRVFGKQELEALFQTVQPFGRPFVEGPLPWRLQAMHAVLNDNADFGRMNARGILNVGHIVFRHTDDPTAKMLWLWLFENVARGSNDQDDLVDLMQHESPLVRTHVMKSLAEREELQWNEGTRALSLQGLRDADHFVARAAADALGRHPHSSQLRPLISQSIRAPVDDPLLRHTLRMAIRDHVAAFSEIYEIDDLQLTDSDLREVASVCIAVPTPIAARLLLRYLTAHSDHVSEYLQHAARHADAAAIGEVIRIGKSKAGSNLELQAQLVLSLASGLAQRGGTNAAQLNEWASDVAVRLLSDSSDERISWTAVPIDNLPPSENPWVIAARPSRDGDKDSLFYYSLPKGEQRTGIYRSGTFDLPAKLSFWMAGHNGVPNQPLKYGNHVRLLDAKTREILAESRPPRNDTARRYEWDLSKAAAREGEAPAEPNRPSPQPSSKGRGSEPRQGYIELTDGDTANAYAWLAVGRFSYAPLNPGPQAGRQVQAAEIIGKLKLAAFRPQLASLLADPATDNAARAAIGQAIVALEPDSRAAALVAVLNEPSIPNELRPRMGYAITVRNDDEYRDNLREAMKRIPTRLQATLADTLAGDAAGAEALLTLVESGHAAPRLLLLPNVSSKLGALKSGEFDNRASAITAKLPPANAILDALIVERRRGFAQAKTSLERGQTVFTKHCAACHKLADQGALVGPQLDGIGNRGLDRLLEDILDPNRNVDVAFRTTTLRTTDGRVLSGLVRREEGSQLVFADAQGKEFTIAKGEIEEQQKTPLSLMPANVGEIVSPDEFADLAAFLLNQRATQLVRP